MGRKTDLKPEEKQRIVELLSQFGYFSEIIDERTAQDSQRKYSTKTDRLVLFITDVRTFQISCQHP